jgi:hypothetical protein
LYERAEGSKSIPLTRQLLRELLKEITMKRHNRRFLKVEELERREVPSTGLPGTETVLHSRHDLGPALTSFQWGVGRSVAETGSMNGPVGDVRLRRIVYDVATPPKVIATAALPGGSIHMAQPIEILSFNW